MKTKDNPSGINEYTVTFNDRIIVKGVHALNMMDCQIQARLVLDELLHDTPHEKIKVTTEQTV